MAVFTFLPVANRCWVVDKSLLVVCKLIKLARIAWVKETS
jgi:hypothetical protein